MPPTSGIVAEYVKRRWSRYLSQLMTDGNLTRSQVSRALDDMNVGESRVADWLNGKRFIKPETAFTVCERLADKYALRTSGPEGLYACGFLPELLDLMKHLSVDRRGEGDRLAVAYYCYLPYRFKPLETGLAADLLSGDISSAGPIYESELRFIIEDRHGSVSGDAPDPKIESAGAASELYSSEMRATLMNAWVNFNACRLRPTDFDEPARRLARGALEAHVAVIDAMISLARNTRQVEPTCAAPRLWRMLCEWAFQVNFEVLFWYLDLIPDAFTTFHERDYRGRL